MAAPPKPTLLTLPAEIRFMIWEEAILAMLHDYNRAVPPEPKHDFFAHHTTMPQERLSLYGLTTTLTSVLTPLFLISKHIKTEVDTSVTTLFPTGHYMDVNACCDYSASIVLKECAFARSINKALAEGDGTTCWRRIFIGYTMKNELGSSPR